MILYIIFGLFISGLCSEENEETSTYYEDDVLFPYRSKLSHLTEFPQDEQNTNNFHQKSKTLKNIQYAPLINKDEPLPTRAVDQPNLIRKKPNLEPRIIKQPQTYDHTTESHLLNYVKGHNILVPHKINNLEPNINEFKQETLSEKNKGNNHNNELPLLHNYQEKYEYEKVTDTIKTYNKTDKWNRFKNIKPFPTTRSFQELTHLEKIHMKPVFNPFVKVPRLHLNIARAYNFAKLPLKASFFIHPSELKRPKQSYGTNIENKKNVFVFVGGSKNTL